MILGIAEKAGGLSPRSRENLKKACGLEGPFSRNTGIQTDTCLFASVPPVTGADTFGLSRAEIPGSHIQVLVEGRFYNKEALVRLLAIPADEAPGISCAQLLLMLYEKTGEACLTLPNGKYALVIADHANRTIIAAADRLGEMPLYYHDNGRRCVISNSLAAIKQCRTPDNELNHAAVFRFLSFSYNPGCQTFLKNVYRLGTGEKLILCRDKVSISRYWRLSFVPAFTGSPDQCRNALGGMMADAVTLRMAAPGRTGVLLSGGIDSSAVAAFAVKIDPAICCFSYRCSGPSYDELHYARKMAESLSVSHETVDFTEKHMDRIQTIVTHMDEPFCDIGVDVATFVVGELARGKVSCVLSGDGGDELFGGHPVYLADRANAVMDRTPMLLRQRLSRLAAVIPDSSKKKDLSVKIKRFLHSLRYPGALHTHRWRILFDADEMRKVLDPAYAPAVTDRLLFDPVIAVNREAGAEDRLGVSLFSDYATTVTATLSRLRLLGALGLDSRPPLLDYRLVEFCAGLPSNFKIRGMADTKYIFKQAMRGILPDAIVFRKDKLGNSIPLKNWIRHSVRTQALLRGVLSPERLRKRGLLNPEGVDRMMREHISGKTNHSHRLWAMVVLELWLSHHMDG